MYMFYRGYYPTHIYMYLTITKYVCLCLTSDYALATVLYSGIYFLALLHGKRYTYMIIVCWNIFPNKSLVQ